LRLHRQSRLHARLGRRHRHGRFALDVSFAVAVVVLLHARELRPVHAVPRRHGLALSHGRAHRQRTGARAGHRAAQLRLRQHPGPYYLRAGRRGGDAGAGDDQALQAGVHGPDREKREAGPFGPARSVGKHPSGTELFARRRCASDGLCGWRTACGGGTMIEIDLDGQKVSVPEGSMVMHAADLAGTYIPHFCYHKKLTIAANCRMCLVDIEKAPKPMPACATPVTQGMIVHTKSDKALNAQQGVMEFLLINHPLDCPICDQGGECQLQDLAVGYGASTSRYDEDKRVVFPKDVGPLISMKEMNRCIHCTRCVRFGQEVAGVMELGMIHRGEHSEITTIAGKTIDSELSGNMIAICPVGALTSKPFRYSARTWELSRRKSVSPHDSTGANLIVQVKGAQVMRVVPLENEDVNECWLADRDRFSYEAFNSPERLTTPMIKQGGEWKAVDWTAALDYVSRGLTQISVEHGAASVGVLASPISTVEELHLVAKLARALGSENVDTRLREVAPASAGGPVRWLGRSIASLSDLQRVLVIGSFLRKDHPLFAQRIRQAAKKGAKVMSVHALRDDWLMPMGPSLAIAPSAWAQALADIAAQVAASKGVAAPAPGHDCDEAKAIAMALLSGERKA